jgi:sporulation protein YunB
MLRRLGRWRWPAFDAAQARTWVVVALLALVCGSFVLVEANLDQTIVDVSRVEARQLAIRVLSEELYQVVGEEPKNLFSVEHVDGNLFIQPNLPEVNRLAAEASLAIEQALRRLPEDPVEIPLGQALGSKLLAAYGPMIPVTLIPYGALAIDFKERFEEAGINQTLFVIYLETDEMVQIVVPLVSQSIHLDVQIPIAQGWIVGRVPQTYVTDGLQLGSRVTIPIGAPNLTKGGSGTPAPKP